MFETIFDEGSESSETRIVMPKFDTHQQGADYVGCGRGQVGAQLHRFSLPFGHILK